MAKVGMVENGLRKRKATKRRRRNPATAAKVTKNPARRTTSLATAKSIIKRNGLKAVSLKAVANGRKHKKRRRRNGIATVTRRNGFLGNTKSDAKQVAYLGGAALGTKALGRALAGFISPILSQVGVGQYTEILTDLGIAIFIAPFVGQKVGGSEGAKMMRLGGLLTVGLDAVEMFAPNFLSMNPFNNSPVVMTGAGAAVSPSAVAAIARDVETGATSAAKVAGVMRQLDQGGAQVINSGIYSGSDMPEAMLVV